MSGGGDSLARPMGRMVWNCAGLAGCPDFGTGDGLITALLDVFGWSDVFQDGGRAMVQLWV